MNVSAITNIINLTPKGVYLPISKLFVYTKCNRNTGTKLNHAYKN